VSFPVHGRCQNDTKPGDVLFFNAKHDMNSNHTRKKETKGHPLNGGAAESGKNEPNNVVILRRLGSRRIVVVGGKSKTI
jgi:hypothetical protein